MVTRDDPYISSLESTLDIEKVGWRTQFDMSKTIIDITGNNLDSTVDINEYRDYIYVGARNIIRRYVKN